MTLNDHLQRLGTDWSSWYFSTPNRDAPDNQLRLYEIIGQRMDLANRVRLNTKLLKEYSGSSINRTFEEMDKLNDPAWNKLKVKLLEEDFGDCIFCESPHDVMNRIVNRTMNKEEYNSIIDGTHPVFARKPIYKKVGHAVGDLVAAAFAGTPCNESGY